jgi:hypothetical protein
LLDFLSSFSDLANQILKPFNLHVRSFYRICKQTQLTTMDNTFGKYLTLAQIAGEMRIPVATLKAKLHVASKAGIELPPRRRIGKSYLYDANAFSRWLWQHAESLRRHFEKSATDVESAE